MITYPNQRVVCIQKDKCRSNFLQIDIDDWQEASKVLSPTAFKIYLYLASNADGYKLALSPKAIDLALNIKKTAYYSAISQLIETGYLEESHGNTLIFHTKLPIVDAPVDWKSKLL